MQIDEQFKSQRMFIIVFHYFMFSTLCSGNPSLVHVRLTRFRSSSECRLFVQAVSVGACHVSLSSQKAMTCCGHLTLATLADTSSASSLSAHLMRNMSWPLASDAPETKSLLLSGHRANFAGQRNYAKHVQILLFCIILYHNSISLLK